MGKHKIEKSSNQTKEIAILNIRELRRNRSFFLRGGGNTIFRNYLFKKKKELVASNTT